MNHPHGSKDLNAKRIAAAYEGYTLYVPQSSHPMDKPSDVWDDLEDSNVSVGGLMGDRLGHGISQVDRYMLGYYI